MPKYLLLFLVARKNRKKQNFDSFLRLSHSLNIACPSRYSTILVYFFFQNSFLIGKDLPNYFGKDEFILVLIISTVSQIGDFIISFFKRKAKIKNTGSIIPGQ